MNKPKKDLLFLNQFFYPEYNSSATLPFDTAGYFASKGLSVDALVGFPKEYSIDKDLPIVDFINGIRIKRVKYIQLKRTGKVGRLINYFSFTFHVLFYTSYLKNYKAVVVYSNPPILPIVPVLARKKYGTKFVFVAYDVYPEVAYASQSLTPDSFISRVMNWINKKIYSSVDCVVALTDEMKDYLLEHRPDLTPDRVVTIPNWAHESVINPGYNAYERYGYTAGHFIVSYLGNMGTCQDIQTLLEAAEMLKDDDRIRFMIAGHGNKRDTVEALISDKKLSNVQLLSYLTGMDLQEAIAISSCFIVTLEKGLKGTCAPSKYYTYLQGGRPVIAVVEKETYLAYEVEREGIGHHVEIGDGEGLRNAIISLVNNPETCKTMGFRAKELYARQYSYETAMTQYKDVIRKVIR